jgi:hypothetical protein
VFHQFFGFRKYTLEESASFNLLGQINVEGLYGSATTNDTVEILAVPAKIVTIRHESESAIPTNKFASHMKNRAVRVDRALLV